MVNCVTDKWQPRWKVRQARYFFMAGPPDVLEVHGLKEGVFWKEHFD